MPARLLAATVAATLGLGLAATTADASQKVVRKSQGVTATLVVHDVKNKPGHIKDKKFLQLKVVTPAPVTDSNGTAVPTRWYASLTITGSPSCKGYTSVSTTEGSDTVVWPFDVKTKKSKGFVPGVYVASGACKVKAEVRAYRYTVDPSLEINTTIKVTATGNIQSDVRATKVKASSTSVKKNKTTTLSGTVTYQKASSKTYYKYTAAPKGTKAKVQFKAKGSKTWKTVKAVKVGSKGHWSAKVKVAKTGTWRLYVPATSKLQSAASASITVKTHK
ncbi:hypothetical protein [Cellulomonas sp. HZM]|uniref:hypothetical protein n=1 Tax=Cellulomonas sp. HZM TaxID=1454010 RepID=UPI0012DEE901|nr:hypothetical protein [Cellulomonas sp. HZM]